VTTSFSARRVRPAGRAEWVESMVGLFANALPTRVHIEGGLPLKEWFKRLQYDHAQSEAFSFMPLDAILAWSGLTSGKPLFRSLVIFENDPVNDGIDRYKDLMGNGRYRCLPTEPLSSDPRGFPRRAPALAVAFRNQAHR